MIYMSWNYDPTKRGISWSNPTAKITMSVEEHNPLKWCQVQSIHAHARARSHKFYFVLCSIKIPLNKKKKNQNLINKVIFINLLWLLKKYYTISINRIGIISHKIKIVLYNHIVGYKENLYLYFLNEIGFTK